MFSIIPKDMIGFSGYYMGRALCKVFFTRLLPLIITVGFVLYIVLGVIKSWL